MNFGEKLLLILGEQWLIPRVQIRWDPGMAHACTGPSSAVGAQTRDCGTEQHVRCGSPRRDTHRHIYPAWHFANPPTKGFAITFHKPETTHKEFGEEPLIGGEAFFSSEIEPQPDRRKEAKFNNFHNRLLSHGWHLVA